MINRKMFALALCVGLATGAQAEVLYSTGFEAPTFSLGSIHGQDSWYISEGASPAIQDTTVQSGSQALGIVGFGDAGHGANAPVAGQVFSLQCDFLRNGSGNNQSGIYFSGDTGFIAQLVSGNKDSGSSWYFLGGYASATEASVSLADGQWHHLNLILDIAAQSITGYADEQYLGSLAMDTVPFPTAITEFGLYQYADDGSGSYFDNVSFEAVPAPGAAAILGLAGAIAARRRR